jgi:GT2 family glycosyltransferase
MQNDFYDITEGNEMKNSEIDNPMVSIIIPNYNGLSYLDRCIRSIYHQTYQNIEIIFVDNASSDTSTEYVTSVFPDVRVIKNPVNLGFSGGVNTGIRASRGEYIFTLNTDTMLDPDCIQVLVRVLDQSPGVGMCGPKLLFFDGIINSTGMCYSRGGKAWDRGINEEDKGQYDGQNTQNVAGLCAGAALYRLSMLKDIGLFDEDFFLIFEDFDLSVRAHLAGWKSRFVYNARVFHVRGGTMEPTSPFSVFYGERNKVWVPIKNYHFSLLFLLSPFIMWENLASVGYWMKKGRGNAALRGKMAAIFGLPIMIKKRRKVKKIAPLWFSG